MQIEVNHLVKEYKRKKDPGSVGKALASMFHPQYDVFRAVDDINFQIRKGEAVGYVGPNGSGKSTTIKMLSGVLTPTAGKVLVNGLEPSRHRMKVNKHVGVVFGNRSVLWWDVPVIESYKVLQQLYEIPERRFRQNLEEFSELMEMEQLLGTPERQLSLRPSAHPRLRLRIPSANSAIAPTVRHMKTCCTQKQAPSASSACVSSAK